MIVVKDTILKAIHNHSDTLLRTRIVVKDTILKAIHNWTATTYNMPLLLKIQF